MSGLVEAGRYGNSMDAGLARSLLEAEGLHCVLFDQGFSSAEGVGHLISIRLMVLDEDLEKARALLPEPAPASERDGPVRLRARGKAWFALIVLFLPVLSLPVLLWLD